MTRRLNVKALHFMPGEHDASLDAGRAFGEFFGPTHYAFDHKGVHFLVLDNVSDPAARLGDVQLAWLADDIAGATCRCAHRGLHAPAAVRPVSPVGLGHAGRAARHRHPHGAARTSSCSTATSTRNTTT